MDCNALDIMALQIERYSFSEPTGAPHISILPSRRFAGTHEVSAAKHNGSIGVWIMVYSPPQKSDIYSDAHPRSSRSVIQNDPLSDFNISCSNK